MEDKDFIGKCWKQNCGDDLFVIEKTNEKKDRKYLYKCQFQKYFLEGYFHKDKILRGVVNNPQIEQVEFIDKIWLQNCGDSLKIIKKSDKKQGRSYLWECEFIKYPYKVISSKDSILKGQVINPEIENQTFIGKIFPQNCGDSLKVLKKSDKREENSNHSLYECEFIKYPYKCLSRKDHILDGYVKNKNLPWSSKDNLENFIKINFADYKPTLKELESKLNIAYTTVVLYINQYSLQNYISYPYNESQNSLKEFIKNICNQNIISNYWDKDIKKEIDVYIPSLKLGFEYNGNYWHSSLYKKDNEHQEKSILAKEKGIDLIHVFEYELNNKKDILESLIKSKLGFFIKKIYARKCIIKELDYNIYKNFCNENHLQGECGAKVKLGLFYENELVQVMSFGAPRFSSNYEWEIIRECSKLGHIIIGGKEKLWYYFLKNFSPNNCLSYCDFSKFTGSSYLKLGFKLKQLNKPGFVWWDSKTNQTFLRTPWKHQEYKEKYLKIYDAGQLVFEWEK